MRIALLLLSLSTITYVGAQPTIAIGEWRDHFPFTDAKYVVDADNEVVCATQYAGFAIDKQTQELTRLSKTNGLSDVGVSALAYDQSSGTLLVGFKNGNIDMVSDGITINLPFIKMNTSLIGNKRINHIRVKNGLAYLSCGFGIVVVDIANEEIKETYIIGPGNTQVDVFGTESHNDTIFAATDQGLFMAWEQDPFLQDFSNWSTDNSVPPQVTNDTVSGVLSIAGELVMYRTGNSDGIWKRSSGWQTIPNIDNRLIVNAGESSSNVLVCHRDTIAEYDLSGNLINEWTIFDLSPTSAVKLGNDIYASSEVYGLVHFLPSGAWLNYLPSGPESIGAFNMESEGGQVWVVAGSAVGTFWGNKFIQPAISSFIDNEWTRFGYTTVPQFLSDTAYDVLSVAINPSNPSQVFAGTLSPFGLIELRENTYYKRYNSSNSTLQENSETPGSIGISDMAFDNEGNLWIANMYCDDQLVVRTASGSWGSMDLGNSLNDLITDIAVGDNGYKWLISPGDGVWVYDDNGTIADDSDDQKKLLTTSIGNGALPSVDALSIAVDLDGEVWIGTTAGPVVFYSPESIFSGSNFDGQQILIEQDGNLQLLLETEAVTAIAIDGANRKWIGTQTSGAFLMSEDGTEQVLHFTTDNSPLLSNEILSIAVNDETGEVYFGTSEGVISYRGVATEGDPFFTNVYAYPNPVREDYFGPIIIKGLARNSDVKITDVAGNVVFFTTSQGGQAVWEGNNFNGERAKTGVYLVFATDNNGEYSQVTKILLVN